MCIRDRYRGDEMKDYDSIRPEIKVEYKLWEKVVIAIGVLGILFSIIYLVITLSLIHI